MIEKQPRERDDDHLALIRKCACLCCGYDPAGEAAHLRISTEGKQNAGIGAKPDDKWTNPLCHDCHMEQHSLGEKLFWENLDIDPFDTARTLFQLSPNLSAMRTFAWEVIG